MAAPLGGEAKPVYLLEQRAGAESRTPIYAEKSNLKYFRVHQHTQSIIISPAKPGQAVQLLSALTTYMKDLARKGKSSMGGYFLTKD